MRAGCTAHTEGGGIVFRNIGRKIKGLAKVLCWIGIIFSILGGVAIALLGATNMQVIAGAAADIPEVSGVMFIFGGVLVAVVGSLSSWIGSWLLYGIGQLIDNSDHTRVLAAEISRKLDM